MLKLLVALVVLFTPSIHAAEILYANYPQEAPVSHAGLLVWSEGGDLRITRLGARGQVLATHTVDVPQAELSLPSIASDGRAYLVAFVCRSFRGTSVAVVPVDAAGAPGSVRIYGAAQESRAPARVLTPSLVRTPGAYVLWGQRTMYMLDGDGLLLSESEGPPAGATVVAGDAVLTFSTTTDPGGLRCTIGGRSCRVFPPTTTIEWRYSSPDVVKSGSLVRPWSKNLELVAAGNDDGTEFVIAWMTDWDAEAIVVREGEGVALVKVPVGNVSTTSSIAFDGSRYLFAFESLGNIHGAFISAEGAIVPFPIAATGLAEERPAVVALARGRFLVTYKSGSALAGQVLLTPDAASPRRRSVR